MYEVEDVQYQEKMQTRLNLEVSLAPEMVELALSLKPESVCLVPENRKEVTTEVDSISYPILEDQGMRPGFHGKRGFHKYVY